MKTNKFWTFKKVLIAFFVFVLIIFGHKGFLEAFTQKESNLFFPSQGNCMLKNVQYALDNKTNNPELRAYEQKGHVGHVLVVEDGLIKDYSNVPEGNKFLHNTIIKNYHESVNNKMVITMKVTENGLDITYFDKKSFLSYGTWIYIQTFRLGLWFY